MAVYVLDDYYLVITLLITIAYQLFFFSIAWTFKFDKVTDFAGGTNFILLAVLTLAFSPRHDARQIVASLFIITWALRLSGFLLFRILKSGTDTRFDDKRDKFFSFLGFWVFQMIWVWTVSLPVTLLNSPAVQRWPQPRFGQGRDVAGVVLWTVGVVMEAVSDVQKYRFKVQHEGDKGAVCDVGFFRWSRHPNYFGEIIVQFAIFTVAVTPAALHYLPSAPTAALYASILGPILLTLLLLFVSGLTLQERPGAKKRYENGNNWEGYKEYLDGTSILLPMPKSVWRALPVWVKRSVGMEWPLYVFDPVKHADEGALVGGRSEEGDAGRGG